MFRIIIATVLLLIVNIPISSAQFNKLNADFISQFANKSRWVYVTDTESAEYYIDEANSRALENNDTFSIYNAYILSVSKQPGPILASVENILYMYSKKQKQLFSSLLDFRTYNASGTIFTPKGLNRRVPTGLALIKNERKAIDEKIFPYVLK